MGSFQDLLNRFRGVVPNSTITNTESLRAPSQMPRGIDHGITGNLSDIHNRPFDYGMKGGMKQMPYTGGGIPGTAIGNMGGMATDFGKGIEAIKEAKEKGGLMNEETRRMMEMLQGY